MDPQYNRTRLKTRTCLLWSILHTFTQLCCSRNKYGLIHEAVNFLTPLALDVKWDVTCLDECILLLTVQIS